MFMLCAEYHFFVSKKIYIYVSILFFFYVHLKSVNSRINSLKWSDIFSVCQVEFFFSLFVTRFELSKINLYLILTYFLELNFNLSSFIHGWTHNDLIMLWSSVSCQLHILFLQLKKIKQLYVQTISRTMFLFY